MPLIEGNDEPCIFSTPPFFNKVNIYRLLHVHFFSFTTIPSPPSLHPLLQFSKCKKKVY